MAFYTSILRRKKKELKEIFANYHKISIRKFKY